MTCLRNMYHVISDFISRNVITFAALEVDVKTVTSSRGFHTAPFHFVGLPLAAIYLRSPLVYFLLHPLEYSVLAKTRKGQQLFKGKLVMLRNFSSFF